MHAGFPIRPERGLSIWGRLKEEGKQSPAPPRLPAPSHRLGHRQSWPDSKIPGQELPGKTRVPKTQFLTAGLKGDRGRGTGGVLSKEGGHLYRLLNFNFGLGAVCFMLFWVTGQAPS